MLTKGWFYNKKEPAGGSRSFGDRHGGGLGRPGCQRGLRATPLPDGAAAGAQPHVYRGGEPSDHAGLLLGDWVRSRALAGRSALHLRAGGRLKFHRAHRRGAW